MPKPKVLLEKCYSCGACIYDCKFNAIKVIPSENNKIRIDYAKCTNCGACIKVCPYGAIEQDST